MSDATSMKRILLVDDEPNVLEGFRAILRKDRARWEIVFAPGGQAALAELANAPFDVVVTDLRMPGVDGNQVLQWARELYPQMTRVLLSGHADRESVVRSLSVAHQFLDKPCQPENLRAIIERACQLQELLHSDPIRKIVGKIDRLPSLPRVYAELTALMAKAEPSVEEIAEVVERDAAMSAKILQLVNSAYFGIAQSTTSVKHAVSYLGLELLRVLSLSIHVFATLDTSPELCEELGRLQDHSLLVGRLARQFFVDPVERDAALTVGVVHDMGEAVLALHSSRQFGEIAQLARSTRRPLHVVEREVLGASHAEIGGYLLGTWGLPMSIVEVVRFHHDLAACPAGSRRVLAALHVADALVDRSFANGDTWCAESQLDVEFLEQFGFIDEWRTWAERAERELASWNSVQS